MHVCECAFLQGLAVVQASGEAEAACAALDAAGVVDGCASRDVDVALFGARRVYKTLHLQVLLTVGGGRCM